MSDDNSKTTEAEEEKEKKPLDSSVEEDTADGIDTGKDTESELFEGKQKPKSEDLELSEEKESKPVKSKANEQAEKQIDKWTARIFNGEVKLEELPKDLSWMKMPILERLAALKQGPKVKELIREELALEREEARFDQMRDKLNEVKLTNDQRQELLKEYKDLKTSGLHKAKALEKALRITQISLDPETERQNARYEAMQVPASGGAPASEKSIEDLQDMSPEERLKFYENLRRQGRKKAPY